MEGYSAKTSTQTHVVNTPLTHEVRPRFQLLLNNPATNITLKINAALQQPDAPCQGKVNSRHALLMLHDKEQHYWSPQLSLNIQEDEYGSLVRGLYGPRPAVWTMFVFFYSLIAFATLVVAVIGASRVSLGMSGMILWALPVLLILFLSLYLVAYFGKRTGREQMLTLHHFVENCLGVKIGEE